MADNTEKNRSHWNENASTYNTKFKKTIEQIINQIQARKDWIGVDWVEDIPEDGNESGTVNKAPRKTVRLLDYACGTGLVSRALAPYVSQCVGVDLSEGMVEEYNKTAKNQGIPASEMHATVGNLIPSASDSPSANLAGPEFHDFDIAVVGLGFHHFDKPALAAKRLTERLKKGGVLMIIDFLPHAQIHKQNQEHEHGEDGEHGKAVAETITQNGFSEEDMKKMFEDAGAGGRFEYVAVGKGIVFSKVLENGEDMKMSVFMAKGNKL